MAALRWVGGLALVLVGGLVLIWCSAVIAWDDDWGGAIEAWHLLAVGIPAAGLIPAGIFGVRRKPALLAVGAPVALATLFGVLLVLGADH